ncbi:MAG TPA: DUF3386 family protein [Pirellulales bacterium]|jgi:hypothetical protein
MRSACKWIVLLTAMGISRPAAAHFLWLQVDPADKPTRVNLWFSESFEPGDANLLDKVAKTKAWICEADGSNRPLVLQKQVSGDQGAWSAAIEAMPAGQTKSACIEATCDYGVVSRGGSTFLLQYSARHLPAGTGGELRNVANHSSIPLEVNARQKNNELAISIQFDKKPTTDAQLFVIGPDNEERELKLDSNGNAQIEKAAPGNYAIRAGLYQKISGERDGKKYDEVRHWSTLTFELASGKEYAAAAPKKLSVVKTVGDPAAVELLRKARDGRAVWVNFPGFTADVSVAVDGKSEHGALAVDDSSTASVKLTDEKLREWAEEQASTLVQHRLPSGFSDEKPTFADDGKNHPLGRLIQLGDSDYSSAYRIRDNMVTEVNRHAGPVRFTISVLETEQNKDGKYLPRVFSMTTWDEKTNQVKSSSTYLNTWTRVGNFDLPERILEVQTGPGDRHVREMTFTNYRLSELQKK